MDIVTISLNPANRAPNTPAAVAGLRGWVYDLYCANRHSTSGSYTSALCFCLDQSFWAWDCRGHHVQPENEANLENKRAKEHREIKALCHRSADLDQVWSAASLSLDFLIM